jgi:TetR/AcrR family transcriptional repressor of mexJK operon
MGFVIARRAGCDQAGNPVQVASGWIRDSSMTASFPIHNHDRLPPRDPRGGRPTQDIAAKLGTHILKTALEQFVIHGPDGASMESIAAAADVSKRTLYARFGSKTGLLTAALEFGTAHYLKPITSTIPEGSPRDKLFHVASEMLDLSLEKEVIGILNLVDWIADHGLATDGPRPLLGMAAGMEVIMPILKEAAAEHGDTPEDLTFLAAFIFDALVSIPRARILDRREMANTVRAKAEYLERAMQLIVRAVPFLGDGTQRG